MAIRKPTGRAIPQAELILAAQAGSRRATEQLLLAHEGLVRSLVARHRGRRHLEEDLLQAGRLGLLLAIQTCDVRRGVRLSTHAVWQVRGELQRVARGERRHDLPESRRCDAEEVPSPAPCGDGERLSDLDCLSGAELSAALSWAARASGPAQSLPGVPREQVASVARVAVARVRRAREARLALSVDSGL